MDAEIDINKIAAEFLSAQIDTFVDSAKGILGESTASFRARLKTDYGKYVDHVAKNLSFTKSFFIRTEPTYLYDFYVPLGLKMGKHKIQKPRFSDIIEINNRIVITGIVDPVFRTIV